LRRSALGAACEAPAAMIVTLFVAVGVAMRVHSCPSAVHRCPPVQSVAAPFPHQNQAQVAPSLEPSKHGRDPRAGRGAIVADAEFASSIVPAAIGELRTVGELQAAIDMASGSGRTCVALVFQREGCKACGQASAPFQRAAKQLSDHALCFTVDCMAAKEFAKDYVGLKVVPSAHLYVDGELTMSTGIGTTPAWRDYRRRLYRAARVPRGYFLRRWLARARAAISIDPQCTSRFNCEVPQRGLE
jgi:hypothetical protein